MAKHTRRRWRRSSGERTSFPTDESAWNDPDPFTPDDAWPVHPGPESGPTFVGTLDTPALGEGEAVEAQPGEGVGARPEEAVDVEQIVVEPAPDDDWFGPSDAGDEMYAARRDVSLASMLMLGSSPYQRIDGMGLARKALENPPTGDTRRDISEEERAMLANARAWCLLVHGDLGHRSRLDDPFVLADAERFVEFARAVTPGSPSLETTVALLRIRQGRTAEALVSAERALELFAQITEHQRGGRTQGAAILAVVTHALAAASSGDVHAAQVLSAAARAVATPLDLDEAAFSALLAEVDREIARSI